MKRYQASLQRHLGDYARLRLGALDKGTYKGRQYQHILPYRQRYLNFLESVRAELQDYIRIKSIKLHMFFHHLNSSQAFALNLFYPYFKAGGNATRVLSAALGVDSNVADWEFEYVPDEKERTNVDVMWRTPAGTSVFCEVKLSETGFGTAKNDDSHQRKLAKIYRPRLKAFVSENLLQERVFFENYQLLRNIYLLTDEPRHKLVILVPRENESLHPSLQKVLESINPSVRERIVVAYVEDCLAKLQANPLLSPDLRVYAARMQEKYVLP